MKRKIGHQLLSNERLKPRLCKCGGWFKPEFRNQQNCPDCSDGSGMRFNLGCEDWGGVQQRVKRAADESGNPQVWIRGMPLSGLSAGLRERIVFAERWGM